MKSRSVVLRSGQQMTRKCTVRLRGAGPSRWQHRPVGGGTAVVQLWPVSPGQRAGPVPSEQERTVRREWLDGRAVGR
jgi:hypothetical protein